MIVHIHRNLFISTILFGADRLQPEWTALRTTLVTRVANAYPAILQLHNEHLRYSPDRCRTPADGITRWPPHCGDLRRLLIEGTARRPSAHDGL